MMIGAQAWTSFKGYKRPELMERRWALALRAAALTTVVGAAATDRVGVGADGGQWRRENGYSLLGQARRQRFGRGEVERVETNGGDRFRLDPWIVIPAGNQKANPRRSDQPGGHPQMNHASGHGPGNHRKVMGRDSGIDGPGAFRQGFSIMPESLNLAATPVQDLGNGVFAGNIPHAPPGHSRRRRAAARRKWRSIAAS